MEPAAFVHACRLVIVAGKGGVGKTTVAATIGEMAAAIGARVLIVDVDGARGIATAFDQPDLRYEQIVLRPADAACSRGAIHGRRLTPDDALVEYLGDHGMKRLAGRLVSTGALDVIATATPGIKDILILGKVKQIVTTGGFDLVVLDTPASGHAITFLRSARTLVDTVTAGPIRRQAEEVLELLTDKERCQVVLVTLAEETPVNEAIDTAFMLEDHVGVALGPIVVNAVLEAVPTAPDPTEWHLPERTRLALANAVAFETARAEAQDLQIGRLAAALPLWQLPLPLLPGSHIDHAALTALACSLAEAIRAMPEPA